MAGDCLLMHKPVSSNKLREAIVNQHANAGNRFPISQTDAVFERKS
jgi:hypothetical protein